MKIECRDADSPSSARQERRYFDTGFYVILALATLSGLACWWLQGWPRVLEILVGDIQALASIMPKIGAALLLSGALVVLLPRQTMARLIGANSGLRGLALASLGGAVTPGGPMTIYPVAGAMAAGGADAGTLVAYLVSWMTLGFNRILVWELPVMGDAFVLQRLVISLPMGILFASAAGALLPAGPMVSFPIAAALARAGAGMPQLIAFVTAWSLLFPLRILTFETPTLGLPFALRRYALCLPAPILAGIAAYLVS